MWQAALCLSAFHTLSSVSLFCLVALRVAGCSLSSQMQSKLQPALATLILYKCPSRCRDSLTSQSALARWESVPNVMHSGAWIIEVLWATCMLIGPLHLLATQLLSLHLICARLRTAKRIRLRRPAVWQTDCHKSSAAVCATCWGISSARTNHVSDKWAVCQSWSTVCTYVQAPVRLFVRVTKNTACF